MNSLKWFPVASSKGGTKERAAQCHPRSEAALQYKLFAQLILLSLCCEWRL